LECGNLLPLYNARVHSSLFQTPDRKAPTGRRTPKVCGAAVAEQLSDLIKKGKEQAWIT